MFIIYSNNTTQLYSNLVYYDHNTTYLCLVLVVLGSPKVSRVRFALLHTASLSLPVYINHQSHSMHSLASIPLLLISEDKGGPTHGHENKELALLDRSRHFLFYHFW